jgi:hypothetical protein
MRSGFATGRASILKMSPNHRQQASRRRLAILCALVGLALASGMVGSLVHPASSLSSRPSTGPFSYIPSE